MPTSTDIATRIAAQVTTSGAVSNVERGRHDAWPEDKTPCARVYLGQTEITPATLSSPRRFFNHIDIIIEVFVRETTTTLVDDALETALATITDQLEGDRTIDGNADAVDLIPISIEREFNGTDGLRPMGLGTMTWRAAYYTQETA